MFRRTQLNGGVTYFGGRQAVFVAGVATDAVDRIELYAARGPRRDVPLRDNVYAIQVPIADLPAKLVAYDHAGRVIGIEPVPAP